MPMIAVRNFSYGFGTVQVLREVSFAVERGEYVTIVGPNGAGKTTLLKCLMRILRGGSGTIEICGRPLPSYGQRELARRISYVPQADGRQFPFTVEQFVLMGRYPHLSPLAPVGRQDWHAVHEAMDLTGTRQFADRPLGTLSGGERQKVFLAAALAQQAEILLLDEPTTFLDYFHQGEIRGVLARANRRSGVTILAVSHDVNSAALESDRLVALRDGAVVFCGAPGELMKADVLQRVYGTCLLLVEHPSVPFPVIVPRVPSERLS